MVSSLRLQLFALVACVLFALASAKSIAEREKGLYPSSQFDLIDDDGTLDNAIINYLFARQMVNRLRQNVDITDLQRKRSVWKQCAFNAVSCFGK